MNRILEIDPERRFARVQPGVVLDSLRSRAETHQLTFGPDPSTHSRCTLGGMIGNNSCGTHSLLAGKTVDNVEELRVLLYDGTELTVGATSDSEFEAIARQGGRRGEIYSRLRALRDQHADRIRAKFPRIPRRVSGYNLDELLPERGFHVARALVGSEGTCAIVLDAKVTLDSESAAPDARRARLCRRVRGGRPRAGDSRVRADRPRRVRRRDGRWPAEQGRGQPRAAAARARRAAGGVRRRRSGSGVRHGDAAARYPQALGQLAGDPALHARPNRGRSGSCANRVRAPRRTCPAQPPRWEGWDDAAVAPDKLGPTCGICAACWTTTSYQATFYGHFGHGCIHMQVSFDLQSEAGVRKYGAFVNDAADLVVRYGGSISGEHGDGKSRSALLPKMFGPELMSAFREFKTGLGSRQQAQPRQHRRCAAGRDEPAARRELRAEGSADAFPVSRRWRVAGEGDAAVHRHRRVPEAGRRRDVPELHGDARRRAQHARPGAHAVRDAAGRRPARRLERRAGQALARSVPVVQGVQDRVPDQRGHRDVSGRVPVALLREPSPSAARLRVRDGGSVAVAGVDRAWRWPTS